MYQYVKKKIKGVRTLTARACATKQTDDLELQQDDHDQQTLTLAPRQRDKRYL